MGEDMVAVAWAVSLLDLFMQTEFFCCCGEEDHLLFDTYLLPSLCSWCCHAPRLNYFLISFSIKHVLIVSFELGVAHPTFHGKMAICSVCDHLFILRCLGKLDRHKTWSRNSWILQWVLCFHLNLLVARGCTLTWTINCPFELKFLQRRKFRCKLPCFLAVKFNHRLKNFFLPGC